MIERMAYFVKRVIEPTSRTLNNIGIVVLGLMVLMLIYSVVMRKAFTPMKGALELSEFGMVLVTFLFMSANYLRADQMTMDTFIEKLPKKARYIIDTIVHFMGFVILGLMTWQLFIQAMRVQGMSQQSVVLQLPVFPFIYVAAICGIVLTVVYVMHFLNSLMKVNETWRA